MIVNRDAELIEASEKAHRRKKAQSFKKIEGIIPFYSKLEFINAIGVCGGWLGRIGLTNT